MPFRLYFVTLIIPPALHTSRCHQYIKSKVRPIHALKAYREVEVINPLILNPRARRKWGIDSMPWPIYPEEQRQYSTELDARWASEPIWASHYTTSYYFPLTLLHLAWLKILQYFSDTCKLSWMCSLWTIGHVIAITNNVTSEYTNVFSLHYIPYVKNTTPMSRLTLWRWNFLLNFSTSCIWNVNITGTEKGSIMK